MRAPARSPIMPSGRAIRGAAQIRAAAGEEAARAGAPREAAAHFAAMLRHRDVLDPA